MYECYHKTWCKNVRFGLKRPLRKIRATQEATLWPFLAIFVQTLQFESNCQNIGSISNILELMNYRIAILKIRGNWYQFLR